MKTNSFRTVIQKQKVDCCISHKNPVMLIGSCFAENIGEKLEEYKFTVEINPFGILFNPMSIAQGLDLLSGSYLFKETDLHFYQDEWISFSHHGNFSHSDKQTCLETINNRLNYSRDFLRKADFLMLTLGSTTIYKYKGNVVANCHKLPQKEFQQSTLDSQNIISTLANSIEKIRAINRNIQIIFTVSPVRYIKNNMIENTLGKAHLIIAVHELMRRIKNSYYFPAFEIMLDDLRDYRFYNNDMIHPSQTAINYIWEIFSDTFFDNPTLKINNAIQEILLAANHRIKNPSSIESKKFKELQIEKIKQIQTLYPHILFEEELENYK
ncbi:MAG: GSCFA domain-containing protein [Bacteroidales bacterium]|jgi:hypothetical protein|nr:GSCFA domain-containing protein [Bacteroidales bacterium]